MVESQLKRKQLKVVANMAQDLPIMVLPQSELLQVLTNLIQNAVDASPDGAEIMIAVKKAQHRCRIEVTDSGSGISPEMCGRIFEPFFSTKCERQKASMGLGLSISNSLVQAMGGKIELTSQVGRGTTFTIVLPMEEAG